MYGKSLILKNGSQYGIKLHHPRKILTICSAGGILSQKVNLSGWVDYKKTGKCSLTREYNSSLINTTVNIIKQSAH